MKEALVNALNLWKTRRDMDRLTRYAFAHFARTDPREALDLAHQLTDSNLESSTVKVVFETWAEHQPNDALDYIAQHPDRRVYRLQALPAIFRELTKQDPVAAVERLVSMADFLQGANYNAYRALTTAWTEVDPAGFIGWLEIAEHHPLRKDTNFLGAVLFAFQNNMSSEDSLDFALQFDDEHTDGFLLAKAVSHIVFDRSVGGGISALDQKTPLQLLSQIPSARISANMAHQLGRDIASNLFRSLLEPIGEVMPTTTSRDAYWKGVLQTQAARRPEAAINYLHHLSDRIDPSAIYQAIATSWSKHDYEATADWLTSLPPSEARDAARETFVEALAETNPGAQVIWDR